MPKSISPKPWPVEDVVFVEVEIQSPRERQMHVVFENGPRLIIGHPSQIPLAADLIAYLRKMEQSPKGGQS